MDEQRATGSLEEIGQRDDAATSEYRIFGPPGTGKTTNLSRQIRRAVEKYGNDSVLVTSFSRTAAAELTGRDLPISSECIGTLHSHCWHALRGPEIAEAHVEEWNRDNPAIKITPAKRQRKLDGEDVVDDDSDTKKTGDELLERLSRMRGLMLPRNLWPPSLQHFEKKWREYKQANGLLDFTDLIETCLHDVYFAPKNPAVIFVDEAQDLNRMQLSLVRKWGEHARYFIVCGDDDQCVYTFCGATPEAFLDPDIPEDHNIILKQSFRVPRAVHALAEKLIRTVGRRQAKEYLPRNADGGLERLTHGGYKSTEYYILKTATEQIERGKTVMFLASCSYMLQPVVAVLRKHGIPFHNPYRKSNGFWNPLRIGTRVSTASRILSLIIGHPDYGEDHRAWTHGDLAQWAAVLQAKGVLRHGIKAKLAAYDPAATVRMVDLDAIFEPAALESLMAAWDGGHRDLLEWWRTRITSDMTERAKFPVEVAARHGALALTRTPQVIVGTIHSVKGGQADAVYLFPDLSQAGDAQYARGGAARDSVIRLFYVGATRAYEKLYICQRESALSISL